MRKLIDKAITIIFLALIIILNAVGLWFLQGGDLRDLIKGCFDASGCN